MARLHGQRLTTLGTGAAAIALLAAGLATQPAYAIDFDVDGWTGSADTTITLSGTVRTQEADLKAQGAPEYARQLGLGTKGTGTNQPTDGDLNFKQGDLTSQPNRILEEVQLKKDETTIFVRGSAFYDSVLSTGSNVDYRPLDRGSINASGHQIRLLDAFVDQKFDLLGLNSSVRIGNQVINWGESTFIQGGINTAAPINVQAAHSPGTELKDIIMPVTAFDFKSSITPEVNIEAYYQFLNAHDLLDGEGTLFAGNVASQGGLGACEGSSHRNCFTNPNLNATSLTDAPLGYLTERDPDKSAHNLSSEFGFAVRGTIPDWEDAEIGGYFENYASRTPFIQWRTGTRAAGIADELGVIGLGPSTSYTATSGLSLTYPENIHLVGASFNFNGPYGLAFQGEVSHRLNQPILLAQADAAVENAMPLLCDPTAPLFALATKAVCNAALTDPVIQLMGGARGYDSLFQTYKRYPVSQVQFGVTKLWSDIPDTPIQTVTFVAEAGLDYVHNFPKDAAIFNSYNSTDGASGFQGAVPAGATTTQGGIQSTQLASQTSYGYVMLATFDMPHTMPAGIDMTPRITFTHDVQGTSPVGAGFFQAHNASIGVGVDFSYLQNLTFGMSYATNFMIGGSPEQNPNIDKDFVSAYISYSF